MMGAPQSQIMADRALTTLPFAMNSTTSLPPAPGRAPDGPPPRGPAAPGNGTITGVRRVGAATVGIDQMLGALRTLPYGGSDDSTGELGLQPKVRATVSPVIASVRWAAAMFGMVFGTKAALTGDLQIVLTLAVCVFITTWRTSLPIVLGSRSAAHRLVAVTDCLFLGIAVGCSGALTSPFVACVAAAIGVAALGWGVVVGLVGLAAALAGMALTSGLVGHWIGLGSTMAIVSLASLVVAALVPPLIGRRLKRRALADMAVSGHMDALAETNNLLTMLNAVARTLPTSLSLRDAVDAAREQLVVTFRPSVICLIEFDEIGHEWIPKLAEGCVQRPTSRTADLPPMLARAAVGSGPIVVPNLMVATEPGIAAGSRSGLYVRLAARDRTVGLLGLEHQLPDHFSARDLGLLAGFAEILALTLDNARWFGRLRSLGAEEERSRIARDLHDRLGQWLTYISFELERILSTSTGSSPELTQLYNDVQSALDELRDTLRQLRSGVSSGRSLAKVGRELSERFIERTDIATTWTVADPDAALAVPIENELLRILQESLSNIEQHAGATRVDITWVVVGGVGTLTIADDGVGFDVAAVVRDNAYGLVGMRERADAIGARFTIDSEPGRGTTIVVSAGAPAGTKES